MIALHDCGSCLWLHFPVVCIGVAQWKRGGLHTVQRVGVGLIATGLQLVLLQYYC